MARYIPHTDKFTRATQAVSTDNLIAEGVHIAGKVLRLLIVKNRERGFINNKPVNGRDPNKQKTRDTIQNTNNKYPEPSRVKPEYSDKIRIISLDHTGDEGKQYSFIELPTVPLELSYSMNSRFIAIATIGRNNPHYHYTGSEDQLEFTVDWFSDSFGFEDVIFNCRWLETLTKNNRYKKPHRIKLQWGNDDRLFQDDIWLLVHAPYKMKQFNRGYKEPGSGKFISTSLLPACATQTLKFKRVTKGSLLYSEIMGQVDNRLPVVANQGTLASGGITS